MSSRENSVSPTPSFRKAERGPPCKKEESSKMWFRFEMVRMACVIFIACMSLYLKEDTLPTRPLPNHFTQIGTIHHMKFGNNNNTPTLLSVPFYVYESLLWDNMTFQGQNLSALLEQTPLKQSEDYWFQKAALVHPMRTYDPELAQLFVVPTLLNFASDGVALSQQHDKLPLEQKSGACHNGWCNDQLIEQAEMVLADSHYYRRSNGSDHVMVLSGWFASRYPLIKESPVFGNLNLIRFEDRALGHKNRTSFPSTYVGNPCRPVDNKTHDFAFVGKLWKKASKAKRKRFQSRRNVCDWLGNSYNTSLCGEGDQCPALADSKYGFHIKGDTYGANRLLDTLLSGTVPIFTDDRQYDILPSWIDWKLLSVRVNVTSRQEFERGMASILEETDYEAKRNHVMNNRDLLDWRTGVPFDVYMYMFQRAIVPEDTGSSDGTAAKNPYNFTALLL